MGALTRGAELALSESDAIGSRVRVDLSWTRRRSQPAVSLTVVATDTDGQALSPGHQVHFQDPTSTDGRKRFEVLVDLADAPDDVATVAFNLVASGRSLRDLTDLLAQVKAESGDVLVEYPVGDLARTRSLLVLELRRRTGDWHVHAAGEARPDGRSGLLRSFGIEA